MHRNAVADAMLPVGALIAALLVFGLFVWLGGVSPVEMWVLLFKGAFGDWYSWQNTLTHAAPLMLTALCVALPARAGLVIIGGEGALVLGGLAGAVLPGLLPLPNNAFGTMLLCSAAFATGAAWIALAGALRQYRSVNETISSLLLAYTAIAIFKHLVEGPMRDPATLNKPSTRTLDEALRVGAIAGSEVHWGFVIDAAACIALGLRLTFTARGFSVRVVGGNARTAQLVGLPASAPILLTCALGGGCAGLAGAVLMITHKFREVMAYADEVTVLRRGKRVHGVWVVGTTPEQLAQAMVGESAAGASAIVAQGSAAPRAATDPGAVIALQVEGLCAMGDRGTLAVQGLSLTVSRGEILGIAGVAGNGQRELVEALVGQRPRAAGSVRVFGQPYGARRAENRVLQLRALPEEPLRNACVSELSVAQNMALRDFDQPPTKRGWLRFAAWRERARAWIDEYGVKTRSENAPIASLSGGNVQRAVLARELAGEIKVLIAANPVFGLDFAAVAEIHARILQVRAEGRIVFETPAAGADRRLIGAQMGGGDHHPVLNVPGVSAVSEITQPA